MIWPADAHGEEVHESGKGIGHEAIHPSASLQASVVEAAHKHNLLTVAHATSLQDTITVLEAGVDGLAHTFFDEPITAQVIEKYRTNKAFCIPTLTIIGSLTGEGQQLAIDLANDKRASDLLGEQEKQELRDCLNLAAPTSKVAYAYDSVRQLKAAGIDILW